MLLLSGALPPPHLLSAWLLAGAAREAVSLVRGRAASHLELGQPGLMVAMAATADEAYPQVSVLMYGLAAAAAAPLRGIVLSAVTPTVWLDPVL
jgi:hypothetical protein